MGLGQGELIKISSIVSLRISDALIESLVISGDGATIAERFKEFLASGLDELLVILIPVQQEERELHQLMQLIGSLEA